MSRAGRVHLSGLSSELAEQLDKLLEALDTPNANLDQAVAVAAADHGPVLFSELIYLLAHLRFEPVEAQEHWQRIVEYRGSMEERLGQSLDLRVALVSYFIEVARQFESPTVIEMKLLEQTRALAYRDELTGLRNFRFFKEALARELARGERFGEPVSLIMVDIDDFKIYNDFYGHEVGNRALARIGRILKGAVRRVDLAARFGGEEFALVIPATPKTGARELAERGRRSIATIFAGGGSADEPPLTVSMGVATFPADATEDEELIRSADRALYLAKSQGKNQVQLYQSSRRSFPRFTVEISGWHSVPSGTDHALRTVDVSTGGLRFSTDVELALGSLVDVRLEVPSPPRTIDLVGRVVQCHRTGERWEAALGVVSMDTGDRAFLGALLNAKAGEGSDGADGPAG